VTNAEYGPYRRYRYVVPAVPFLWPHLCMTLSHPSLRTVTYIRWLTSDIKICSSLVRLQGVLVLVDMAPCLLACRPSFSGGDMCPNQQPNTEYGP
jgi:hypothetical protein